MIGPLGCTSEPLARLELDQWTRQSRGRARHTSGQFFIGQDPRRIRWSQFILRSRDARMQAISEHAKDLDGDIVGLINAGDLNAALHSLMQRHGTAVNRYCRGALHDPMLADDVHQQIFIEAYRDFAKFAGRATLRIWLFAIARHRVRDAVKSRRRALAHIEEDRMADVPDPGPAPGERIADARLRQALLTSPGELGEPRRTAVLLRYQQGLTFEDTAEVCDEKPGTLQARVSRALQKLRACIEARTGGQLMSDPIASVTRTPKGDALSIANTGKQDCSAPGNARCKPARIASSSAPRASAVGRALGKAPIQIRRWCHRMQIELSQFRGDR